MAEEAQNRTVSLRHTVAQAYAFVKGSEAIESFSSYTYEEALQQQVDRLEGKGDVLMAATAQISQIQEDLSKVCDYLAEAPQTIEEALEETENVNTPE